MEWEIIKYSIPTCFTLSLALWLMQLTDSWDLKLFYAQGPEYKYI